MLADSLGKLGDERVKTRVIHNGVGTISESDVLLASTSNAIIVGFNVGRTGTPLPWWNAKESICGSTRSSTT